MRILKPIAIIAALTFVADATQAAALRAGFAEADATPRLGGKPVYLAGFGHNRKATEVADPIMARAVVLHDGTKKIALVSVDLVGFFFPNVEAVRKQLTGFDYVLVSSTHNHEGPDTLGLWGSSPFVYGADPDYLKLVESKIVQAIRDADAALSPVTAAIGTANAPELLHDAREPIVKHDELVAIRFASKKAAKPVGIVVQWNCHPETLDSKNTKMSADYVGYTVKALQAKHGCPVVYLTGTVGGLMTSLHVEIRDKAGTLLKDGTFEKTERYGLLLAEVADKALAAAKPVTLTPFNTRRRDLYLPVDNKIYQLARKVGVLRREAMPWAGDATKPGDPKNGDNSQRITIHTEIGWLQLGELDVAAIPGEIYPELVLAKVPIPAPEGADFPDAAIEPAIYAQFSGRYRMLIGLACDEIGYILPKRLWDEQRPFTYGRKTAPYGEINSLGPETGPLLCEAFRDMVKGK